MNKLITSILAVVAVSNIILSFLNKSTTGNILGFEINIWIYRLIWAFFGFLFISDLLKKKKENQ